VEHFIELFDTDLVHIHSRPQWLCVNCRSCCFSPHYTIVLQVWVI
jgi:hypothetical protein